MRPADSDFSDTYKVPSKPLNQLRDLVLQNAVDHGFAGASPGEDMALIHSEVSEALEEIRDGHLSWGEYTLPGSNKPLGVPSEMADVIIRVLHFCGKHNIDIESAVLRKMEYNRTRPYKHGGKTL